MEIKIVNKSKNPIPEYATIGAAGMDLRTSIEEVVTLKAHSNIILPTGIFIELPQGYEAQVRGRSGLAFKFNIISHLGTIDSDYRGEIKVKLFNLSDADFVIQPGDRIAQLVISKYERTELNVVEELSETLRSEGGFGHTGIK